MGNKSLSHETTQKHRNTTHYHNEVKTYRRLVLCSAASILDVIVWRTSDPHQTAHPLLPHSLPWGLGPQCSNTEERSRALTILSFSKPHRELLEVTAMCTRVFLPLPISLWIHVFAHGATVSILRPLIIFIFHLLSLLLLSFQSSTPGVAYFSFSSFPELPVIFWGSSLQCTL